MSNQSKVNGFLGVVSQARTDDPNIEILNEKSLVHERVDRSVGFSVFVPELLDQAAELATKMHERAENARAEGASSEDAVSAALEEVDNHADDLSPGIVQHAIKLFLTHNESGRSIKIPSLMRRVGAAASAANGTPPPLGGKTTSALEDQINWFREDPLMNEHHEHWHVVYPYTGFPRGTPLLKDQRQGEMFFYMHQQMLARYDAERLAVGLGRVDPLSDYRAPVSIGYDPGAFGIFDQGTWRTFPPRAANVVLEDVPADKPESFGAYSVSTHETLRGHFEKAVIDLELIDADGSKVPLSGSEGSDLLGATNEPSRRGLNGAFYGNHHGMGHILISNSQNPRVFDGIMAWTEGNLRDPIFWRWHKHVDELNFNYQETQTSHTFDDAPKVTFSGSGRLRSDAISVIRTADIPEGVELDAVSDGSTLGMIPTTDTLRTEIRDGIFTLSDGTSAYSYRYLWHEGFTYVFRMANDTDEEILTTLRVFLCPLKKGGELSAADPWLNDRTLWIEMDKFAVTIPANSSSIIVREDKQSSVIRRPAIESPAAITDIDIPPGGDVAPSDFYCECGWPYHLLLPKGTSKGMEFALMVIATDGAIDLVPDPGSCGSMSYCGAKQRYPDTRPMGYPFDRPLSTNIADLVSALPTFAMRRITIKSADLTEAPSV